MRREVGCHSVIRAVTSGFVDSPTAYAQTAGPNGVTQAAGAETTATSSVRCGGGARSCRSSSQASPRTSGPRKKLPCRLAQTRTMSGIGHSRRGWARRSVDEQQDEREAGHAEQLRPQRQGHRRDDERPERQPGGASHPEPRRRPMSEEAAEDHADERGPQDARPVQPAS